MKGAVRFTIATLLCQYVLSADFLVGYMAQTKVADHAAIDIDQQKIDLMLALGRLENVKKIYEQGGNSQSIARLKIIGKSNKINATIPAGTEVFGKSVNGNQAYGTLLLGLGANDDEVMVQYPANNIESSRNCQVGGLASMELDVTDGCFADRGELIFHDVDVKITYSYNSNFDNVNGRTIQGFSLFAEKEMASCGKNCPYKDFAKFLKYYGEYDYADKWIQAAFMQQRTSFERGNFDFSAVGKNGVEPAIQIATKFMNIWMYAIRMMETALDACEVPCNDERCKDDAVHAWDQAVAFHTGSLQEEGILLYAFADVMCRAFHSCGSDGSMRVGTSYANNMAIEHFKQGQSYILQKQCSKARESKEEIVKAMTIPLIQATLFTAYAVGGHESALSSGDLPTKKARAAGFAATVLPIVHDCNENDANIIYDILGIDSNQDLDKEVNYVALKAAFERNYECMGVTCEGVGGIWEDGKYLEHAAPCHQAKVDEAAAYMYGHFLAMVLLPLAIFGSLVLFRISKKRSRRLSQAEAKQTASDTLDEAGLEDPSLEDVKLEEDVEQNDVPQLPPIT